ncbi:helix-turn-helix transcriptional regulator [Dyadobacter luticola]|uniref:YafY family transcriptional regulator n=1 Tax=Dyadobacter luticola TaxID=1979387 RepID=A0A5R9L3S9_9BACT|nr:YafY family protein [Dyadobacter luticola]TLV03009.1 YafY family transcriptional regulator [Dyadobacter luticola]
MNRFDRITAILIQLQSRKIVKAQDLAERFEISLRTVYRDINSLAEAGVPIVGEAGVGYSIMDGYRLPPVMFTREEARTFITAEKLMEKFTDISTQSHYQSAMFKIKAVLKSNEKSMVENLENHIEIRHNNQLFHKSNSNTLDTLLKSISEKKIAKIYYAAMNADDPMERVIEPVGVYHENNYWYTVAYCYLRNDYRNFRSDRVLRCELTEEPFKQKHAPLKDFMHNPWGPETVRLIRIKIEKRTSRYIREQRNTYGFVSEINKGDFVEMSFLSPSLEWFARWYLMIAPSAYILEPESLKTVVRNLVEKISENIQ